MIADEIKLDSLKSAVIFGDKTVLLTRIEFAMFTILLASAGATVSRDEFIKRIWQTAPEKRCVDVNIKRLKLRLPEEIAKKIKNVYREGYYFEQGE